ncbi:unnamed protein product [Cuscuta campestris]|uniref:No apical meristem-associated C-terminal domain-containing protein n=1 Tax=Cuscuta campestris TaxID=132261 RepID=A0A484MBW4_9ASTE|nr:unnamed protein product [Cuscuta campestris]
MSPWSVVHVIRTTSSCRSTDLCPRSCSCSHYLVSWSRPFGLIGKRHYDARISIDATIRYQDDGHQGKVPIDLWRILSRSPKWQQLNNPDGGSFRKRSTVDAEVEVDKTIGSTDQIPPFNVADSDDEDPIPRPIGRKKAKSIVSGLGGSASVSASSRNEIGREMVEQLRVFNLREQERLKLNEKELKLAKEAGGRDESHANRPRDVVGDWTNDLRAKNKRDQGEI